MKTYTYTQARQKLASILDEASKTGEIRIRRRDGSIFTVRPLKQKVKKSPFEIVKGLDLEVSMDEIVDIVRESRERDHNFKK